MTLAGLLIFQGVIFKVLQSTDTILIEDDWVNYTATYYFSANVGWLIATFITGGYALGRALGASWASEEPVSPRTSGWRWSSSPASRSRASARSPSATTPRVPTACPEGTPLTENCYRAVGLPLAALLMVIFLVGLTYLAKRTAFGRHVYAVGRQRRGCAARRHQRRRAFGSSCS